MCSSRQIRAAREFAAEHGVMPRKEMAAQTFDKRFLAQTQLETALRLYFEGLDYFSAITLAGAAEEILGKLVAENGKDNSLASLQKAAVKIHKGLFGTDTTPKRIAAVANAARNAMKHLNSTPGQAVTFDPRQNAEDIIDRAVENYWILVEDLTPAMARFQRERIEA